MKIEDLQKRRETILRHSDVFSGVKSVKVGLDQRGYLLEIDADPTGLSSNIAILQWPCEILEGVRVKLTRVENKK